MRGFLKGLLVAVSLTVFGSLLGGIAQAQVDRPFLNVRAIKWCTLCNSAVQVDSALKNLDGTGTSTPTVDTTNAIDTGDWEWSPAYSIGPTASGLAKLWIISNSGTVSTTDTLFALVDTSPDGVNWSLSVTTTNCLFATANDNVTSAPFLVDADAAKDPFLTRYMRFRVKSDNSAASTFKNAKFFIAYLKRASTVGN